jgi:hypothetical protein
LLLLSASICSANRGKSAHHGGARFISSLVFPLFFFDSTALASAQMHTPNQLAPASINHFPISVSSLWQDARLALAKRLAQSVVRITKVSRLRLNFGRPRTSWPRVLCQADTHAHTPLTQLPSRSVWPRTATTCGL